MNAISVVLTDGRRVAFFLETVVAVFHDDRCVILASGTFIYLDEETFRAVCKRLQLPEDE
jgi:hypothetical protein